MPLEKLPISDLKKLALYFGINKNKGKEQLVSLIKKELSQQDPVEVYELVDALPVKLLDKYVESLKEERNYLGGRGSSQARWRGNLIWGPLKKLALFSELTELDETALSILLLIIEDNAFLKRKLQVDPILEYLQGIEIDELASKLGLQEELENIFSCYDILKKSSFEIPTNVKSQNWARIFIKKALELPLTENEELQSSIITMFQSEDSTHFVQALSLLESLFSLEEIAQFFGFAFSEVFNEELEVNLSVGEDSSLLEWMAWIKGDARIAAYVLLWFLGIVYEQEPEKIRFKEGHFTFSFAAEFDDLDTCFQQGFFSEAVPPLLWHNYQFNSIPPEFYQIGNIHSLVPSKEMGVIPAELLCLPNLKAVAFGNLIRKIKLIDGELAENSPIELLIIQGSQHHTVPIPAFVWTLPKLKKLLVRNVSAFQPPRNLLREIGIEELKIFFTQKAVTLNLSKMKKLRKIEIDSEKTKISWQEHLPNIETITLSDTQQFILEDLPLLREISLKSAEVISLGSLPNLESFSLGFLKGKGQYQAETEQIFQVLFQSKKLRKLVYGSHANDWPETALEWENLEILQISRWQGLLSMPKNLSMPKLKQLICNPLQLKLGNLPQNIEHLRIVNPNSHRRARFVNLEGIENFKHLKTLELIDIADDISDGIWQNIIRCGTLQHLRIEKSRVGQLPRNIIGLHNLQTMVLYRTGVFVSQHIFLRMPRLKRIEVQELRGTEIFVPS